MEPVAFRREPCGCRTNAAPHYSNRRTCRAMPAPLHCRRSVLARRAGTSDTTRKSLTRARRPAMSCSRTSKVSSGCCATTIRCAWGAARAAVTRHVKGATASSFALTPSCFRPLAHVQGCASWNWFYPYHYAPFAGDFKGCGSIKVELELGEPFRPYDQLMAVFPPGTLGVHSSACALLLLLARGPLRACVCAPCFHAPSHPHPLPCAQPLPFPHSLVPRAPGGVPKAHDRPRVAGEGLLPDRV